MASTSCSPQAAVVDSFSSNFDMTALLNDLEALPAYPPTLFIDINQYSLLLLFTTPNRIYRINLGDLATILPTENQQHTSLQSVLKSKKVYKATFDIRHLASVLFHDYNVSLEGFEDIQLMELAYRISRHDRKPRSRTGSVLGLLDCVSNDRPYAIFTPRIRYFPALFDVYYEHFIPRTRCRLRTFYLELARSQTLKRIGESKKNVKISYDMQGPDAFYGEGLEAERETWIDKTLEESYLGNFIVNKNRFLVDVRPRK